MLEGLANPDRAGDDIVSRIRAGDRAALEVVFRQHYAALCAFVAGLVRSPETAEELVQDAFATIWAQRERLDVRESLRAYLYGACRNRALNVLERGRRERHWADQEGRALDQPPSTPEAEAHLERADVIAAVQRAVAQLPDRARLAIELRWRHSLAYAEIAEVMGISVKSVENTLSRAMRALREELEGTR